jgi:Holliday junction resolvase
MAGIEDNADRNMTEPKKRKKPSGSPTQRSLKLLREQGYKAGVVEKWQAVPGHPGGGVRQDLLNFIDIMAFKPGEVLAVQCTSASGMSARLAKIRSDDLLENVEAVRASGAKIQIHGWEKKKVIGTKLMRWRVRVVDLTEVEDGVQ